MSTTVTPESATPQDGSLDSAARAFEAVEGLLSIPSEKEESTARQPEQQAKPKKDVKAKPVEQAPAAPESEEDDAPESEPVEQDDESAEAPEATTPAKTYKVKVDGEEVEVSEDELLNGYSRQKDYTKKTMELAKARKEFEEREVATVRQEREQYRTTLVQLEQALQDMTPKEPDWNQLRATLSPDQFSAEVIAWQNNQKRLEAVTAERQRVEGQQRQDAEKGFREFIEQQRTKLIEADPDFGDPTKNKTLNDDLSSYALNKGFTPEEVAQVVDHRLVLILRDAMRYQQLKAKQPAVKNKLDQVITTATPGSSRQNNPKLSKSDQALQRLKQTGHIDDAAAAFMDRI